MNRKKAFEKGYMSSLDAKRGIDQYVLYIGAAGCFCFAFLFFALYFLVVHAVVAVACGTMASILGVSVLIASRCEGDKR